MPDTYSIHPGSLYNYFKSLYAVILIRKGLNIQTPNKQWGTYMRPLSLFPKQNSQSAHIWGWGRREGHRAVRWPLRLHAAQCGKCAVYRNPLQGTAQSGAITHNALISCSVLCICSFLCIGCVSVYQIGHRHVVDATLQEKACSVASLLISVTHRGTVTCVRKMGRGSLDPESIFEMTEVGSFLFF